MDRESQAMDRDRADLNAYYDGELGWWRRRRFEARLDASDELQVELAALRAMGSVLREVDAAAGAPDLWAGVRARMAHQDAEPSADAGWGWRPLWAGVAVAAAALALTLLWRPAEPAAPAAQHAVVREAPSLPAPKVPSESPAAEEPVQVARGPEAAAPVLPAPDVTPVRGQATAPATTVVAAGTVRTIDTGGRPFLVLEDTRDTTIIWLIDGPTQALPARGTSEL